MVLFLLLWLSLALLGAARLLVAEGRVGLWLPTTRRAALPSRAVLAWRMGGPPGGNLVLPGPRVVPRAGGPDRLLR
jgi:hypothetical protein